MDNNYREFDNKYCSHYSALLMDNKYRQFDNMYLFSLFGSFDGCILKNSYNFVIELSHRGME